MSKQLHEIAKLIKLFLSCGQPFSIAYCKDIKLWYLTAFEQKYCPQGRPISTQLNHLVFILIDYTLKVCINWCEIYQDEYQMIMHYST